MGSIARELVRENFLLTRHLRDYLTLMLVMARDPRARLVQV